MKFKIFKKPQINSKKAFKISKNNTSSKSKKRKKTFFESYFYLHKRSSKEAIKRFIKAPFSSFQVSLLIGVALALPALMTVFIDNLHALSERWQGEPHISVYLKPTLSLEKISVVKAEIANTAEVQAINYVSSNDGLDQLQKKLNLTNIISSIGFNPIPSLVDVRPTAGLSYKELERLTNQFNKMQGVDEAILDKEWVKRFQAMIKFFDKLALTLAILFSFVVILSVSNITHFTLEKHRDQLRVVKLIGGTDGFAILPFLYIGFWYGVFGALFAFIFCWAVIIGLESNVAQLIVLYDSSFILKGPGFATFIGLLLGSAMLGIFGAFISCHRKIRQIESTS